MAKFYAGDCYQISAYILRERVPVPGTLGTYRVVVRFVGQVLLPPRGGIARQFPGHATEQAALDAARQWAMANIGPQWVHPNSIG